MFQDKGIFITGAGTGIGYGLCQAFADAGARVGLNDIDEKVANEAATSLNESLPTPFVTPYPCDSANVSSIRAIINEASEQWGRLDIVIANAGITNFGPFLDYTPEAFDRVVSVNLRGTYFTAQAAAQQMIQRGTKNGRIILTASVTGVQGYPNLSTYGMTKAGIIHLARSLAVELGQYGITVNAICPGATLTERTLADDPDYEVNWSAAVPTQRIGQVSDIVNAALFLASPDSQHITGQTIIIDGGWTITSPIPENTPDMPTVSSKLK